jgi:tripartite-type tricarboxylate transporter receptor subunit TctC
LAQEQFVIAKSAISLIALTAGSGWVGPAGLPEPIVSTLRGRILALLHAQDMSDRISQQGWVLTTSTPDELRELIRTEIMRVGKVLKDSAAGEGR